MQLFCESFSVVTGIMASVVFVVGLRYSCSSQNYRIGIGWSD